MAGGHGVMVNDDCPPSDMTSVKVFTQSPENKGRYLECTKGKKTIACTLHRWSFDENLVMTDTPVDIGNFYGVSVAEGDSCVKWSNPDKKGVSMLKNKCAKDNPLAITTCSITRLKTLLPGGATPRIMECSSGTYMSGKEPDDVTCTKPRE